MPMPQFLPPLHHKKTASSDKACGQIEPNVLPKYPMVFVVFQGWPLNATGDIIYENCLDAGGYLKEKEYFVVTFPKNLADTKSKYHRRHCSELEYDSMKISERVLSKEEAVRQYGAFPCEKCFPYVE